MKVASLLNFFTNSLFQFIHLVANMREINQTGESSSLVRNVLSIFLGKKQLFRGVLKKKCSENMQQIHRRTTMPKFDFKCDHTSARMFSCTFAAYFESTF